MNAIDQHLDQVTINQMTWKHGAATAIAVAIVKHALECPFLLWADEINMDFVGAADKNCIGTAWKNLARQEILERGTSFRRSNAGPSKGRTIFSYRLKSRSLAELFLKINKAAVVTNQPEFAL